MFNWWYNFTGLKVSCGDDGELTMWAVVMVDTEVRGVAGVHTEVGVSAAVVQSQHQLEVRYVHPGCQLSTAVPYLGERPRTSVHMKCVTCLPTYLSTQYSCVHHIIESLMQAIHSFHTV